MTGPLERRAARVLLLDDEGRILLQHCHDPSTPAEGSWWNTTGGGLDEGETSAQAAVRELREETGYAPDGRAELVTSNHNNNDTYLRHVVVARDCRPVAEQSLDPLEAITVRVVPVDHLRAELRASRVGAALQTYLALDHTGLLAP